MKKDIFISYSHKNEDLARDIVAFLEGHGKTCYIDHRDIDPGKPYAARITNAINECTSAVIIASSAINGSEHMLNELDIMVDKRKHFVPFFIEDFEMDDEVRYYLGRAQRIIAYPGNPREYFNKLAQSLDIQVNDTQETTANTKKVFDYLPARGIMINPEDRERNVSFRTDTLINLLGGIYSEVVGLSSEESAMRIFHTSGYNSGASFAQRLNSQWDFEAESASLYAEKLKKWCAFDSDVGWGRFDSDIQINEETGELTGRLRINEGFIVDKKNKRHICEFVRGYCEGVMETLLGARVELRCAKCPLKNKFSNVCEFEILLVD